MTPIKNIIFDFGNVLIDIDEPKAIAALGGLMKEDLDPDNTKKELLPWFKKFETAGVSVDILINRILDYSKKTTTPRMIIDAWNSMLLDIPYKRLEMLEELGNNYNVYLLSNTNALHIDWCYKYLEKTYGILDFDTRFFKKTYYSHLLGMRKPGAEIYTYVLNDARINGKVSLFIDDKEENIIAARNAGIRSHLHDPSLEISEIIHDLI